MNLVDSQSVNLPETLTHTVTHLGNSASTCSLYSAPNNAGLISDSKDDCLSAYKTAEQPVSQSVSDVMFTPKDLEKGIYLKPLFYVLDNGLVFHDKLLPDPKQRLIPDNCQYSKEYYVKLHYDVSKFSTYNHLGARIPLEHNSLNVKRFRELLPPDYDDKVVLQYIEFGFPLGLQEDFLLEPVLKTIQVHMNITLM